MTLPCKVALGALHVADPIIADRQIALGAGSVWLSLDLEQALHGGLGGLEVAEGFVERGVIECVIALGDEEPELRVESIGPIRLQSEDVGKETGGLGGLIAVGLELGAPEQREEIGPLLLGILKLDYRNRTCCGLSRGAGKSRVVENRGINGGEARPA